MLTVESTYCILASIPGDLDACLGLRITVLIFFYLRSLDFSFNLVSGWSCDSVDCAPPCWTTHNSSELSTLLADFHLFHVHDLKL